MHKQCVPGALSPPPPLRLGTRLSLALPDVTAHDKIFLCICILKDSDKKKYDYDSRFIGNVHTHTHTTRTCTHTHTHHTHTPHIHAYSHTHTHMHTFARTRTRTQHSWSKVVKAVLKKPNELIDEDQVEVCPEIFTWRCARWEVDVHLVRKYFTNDGWLVIKDVIKRKSSNPVYICKTCFHDLDESVSIVCNHCLLWFHMNCTGLTQQPKQRYWLCRKCLASSPS